MKQCPCCGVMIEAEDLVEVKVRPPGCVCDPGDWRPNEIPPICTHFDPYSAQELDLCQHCQHCLECH